MPPTTTNEVRVRSTTCNDQRQSWRYPNRCIIYLVSPNYTQYLYYTSRMTAIMAGGESMSKKPLVSAFVSISITFPE